ncbi:EF-hand calcium-binding domain-containing protein 11 isoform X2 [Hyperolius riggenbachi]|uniref:EF-hand calcium-binding domain-containing protein 11 isoform X2 n=1 Tax=Hyperolius riggenbachi TaxID=752182 RepID=UPI0035A33FF3
MAERDPEKDGSFLRVFQACDGGKKGFLNREDLKVAVVMLFGYKPSKIEVDSMFSSVSKSGGIAAEEFLALMSVKRSAQLHFGEQRAIFSVFDTHCRGFLNVEDFKRAFKRVAPHIPEHTVLEAFRRQRCQVRREKGMRADGITRRKKRGRKEKVRREEEKRRGSELISRHTR